MISYIGIIHKEANSDYGVSFPDFPGCITAGANLEEAREMAIEALNFHIEGMREDGDPLPAPSSLDDVMRQDQFADGFAIVVDASGLDKSVRVNLTVKESDLYVIDQYARDHGQSRSGFMVQAAKQVMG